MKPGYQTSEFWVTQGFGLVAFLLAALQMSGYLEGHPAWAPVVEIAMGLLAQSRYSDGRAKVKAAASIAGISGENLPRLGAPKPDPTDG
jgi:hypothetical protein